MNTLNNLLTKYPLAIFFLILSFHMFILTKIIFFPYPEFFIYPYLTNIGLTPYKQIFDQHFPGLMFLPINLNNLGMTSPLSARLWLIGIVALTQILLFIVSYRIYKNIKLSLLGSFLYLIWQPFLEGYVLWIDSFLPLFLLPAFYFIYTGLTQKEKSFNLNLFMAGLFLGLSVLFKQVVIPLSAVLFILLVLYRKPLKNILIFLVGFLPIPILMIAYFYILGIFQEFFYWTVVFNLTVFAKEGRKLPTFTGLVRILGIYSPIIFIKIVREKILMILLVTFILVNLSGDIARFDFVHFQPSLPFIILLFIGTFPTLIKSKVFRWFIVLYFLMATIWLSVFYKGHISDQVLFFDKTTYQISQKIDQYSKPNEHIFILGPVPHLYQISNRVPAGKIFVFPFPWFIHVTQDHFIEALKKDKPVLVVRDKTVTIDDDPIMNFASRLENYIDNNYSVIDKVGNTEFLIRK